MNIQRLTALCLCFLGVLTISLTETQAQEALKPRPSPVALQTMSFEDTYIKVTYCRPHKNGRSIFGELVPFGEVWRTGANEATEITITQDIKVAGNHLKSGTYTIFSIPNEDKWTIIFSEQLGQWGAYEYDQALDVLRFDVDVTKTVKVFEPFTIEFEQKEEGTDLSLIWDDTKVSFPIHFQYFK